MITTWYKNLSERGRAIAQLSITAFAALILAVSIVLPAESGFDPLGTGKRLGLTDLADGSTDMPEALPLATDAHQAGNLPPETRSFNVVIGAERQIEVKAKMDKGQTLVYSWNVDRGVVYSDLHGHGPVDGKETELRYQEHQESNSANGAFVAQLSGEHGWYWLNLNDHPVTIKLTIHGYFNEVKQSESW